VREQVSHSYSTNGKITVPLSPRHVASSGCRWREVLRVRRVAANILNKQSRTADKGWSSSLWVVTKCFKALRTWTDSLARHKQWKKDMRFGTWEQITWREWPVLTGR
jgi:hypothetical protein